MKEGTEDAATGSSTGAEGYAPRIGAVEQGIAGPFPENRRIVEFMPAIGCAGLAERAVGHGRGLAIAQVQPAVGKRGFQRQESGHGMALAGLIDKTGTQGHIAAALAEYYGAAASRCTQAAEKSLIGRQPASM